jgi:alpha-1,2-glucosyltransferase
MPATRPFASSRSRTQLGWLALACAWFAGLALAWNNTLHGDEWVHWNQIALLLRGDYQILTRWLTNIPAYHWTMWALMKAAQADSAAAARAINSLFGIAALVAFHALRTRMHPADAQRATAMLALLPILFVFNFLVYTDVLALAFLLAAAGATFRGAHGWAAATLVASMAVRQNNVFWVGGFALFALLPVWRQVDWRFWRAWRESIALAWPYAVAVGIFIAYWAWNGSISYSNAQGAYMHPDVTFDAGNPYYLLFLAALLLPLHVAVGLRRFAVRLRAKPWLALVPIAIFALYAAFFRVAHPYNTFEDDLFIRNALLQTVAKDAWVWFVFGAAATLAACGLANTRFVRADGWLLLPLSLVFVGASWLIETRYAIIPFALFLALRLPESDRVERLTCAWWALLSALVAVGIFDSRLLI